MSHLCDLCGKSFGCSTDIIRHTSSHLGLKPFTCQICDQRFSTNYNLTVHMRNFHSTHEAPPFVSSYAIDLSHPRHAHGDNTLSIVCNECGRSSPNKATIVKHMLHSYTDKSMHRCKLCMKYYKLTKNLKRHMLTHHAHRVNGLWQRKVGKHTDAEKVTEKRLINKYDAEVKQKTCNLVISNTRERRFQCKQCGNTFSMKNNFKRHLRQHSGVRPYVCTECGKSFYDNYQLESHSRVHAGQRLHTCSTCHKSFFDSGTLSKHRITHSDVKPHTCTICRVSFACKYALGRHQRRDSHIAAKQYSVEKKQYICDICGQHFPHKPQYMRHLALHKIDKPENGIAVKIETSIKSEEKTHLCSICNMSFATKGWLTRHKFIHMENNLHPCKLCGRSYVLIRSLQRHMVSHMDKQQSPYVVDENGAADGSNHIKHEYSDDDEKPHFCKICNTVFAERGSLRKHMDIHGKQTDVERNTDDTSHIYKVCDTGFTVKDSMKRHNKESNLECDICEEYFMDRNHLNRHMLTHTWENTPFI